MSRPVAFLSDVEGLWRKLESFCERCDLVRLEPGANGGDPRLVVREGAVFVFGGDAIDRGPDGRRVVRVLADAKLRQPDQVVLIAGNRDVNKMRLVRELRGAPYPGCPLEAAAAGPGAVLSWTFQRTMGAQRAMEMRARELAAEGREATPDAIAASYLEDLATSGDLARYLASAQLAFRVGPTLFVHGAVTEQSLGHVPGEARVSTDVDEWITRLNAFYARELATFVNPDRDAPPKPPYARVVAYQAPVPGTRENAGSVIYGRPTAPDGAPRMLEPGVIERLRASGVRRLVVGHTPAGDAPVVLRARGFELVMADNSYAPCEEEANVIVAREGGDALEISAVALVDGARELVRAVTTPDDHATPIGKVDAATGHFVKGKLASGRWLLWRPGDADTREQIAVDERELAARALVAP